MTSPRCRSDAFPWSARPGLGAIPFPTAGRRAAGLAAAEGSSLIAVLLGGGPRYHRPASRGRSTDTVVTWLDIPISGEAPPPPDGVQAGLTTCPDEVIIPLVERVGQPADQFLALEPIDAA